MEVKSLDGTEDDEKSRVKEALAQLLYYESFVTQPIHSTVRKIACFEAKPSDEHIKWLEKYDIRVIWSSDSVFSASSESKKNLRGHFGF